MNALIYASFQIPRLMMIAHSIWYDYETKSHLTDRTSPLQVYEDKAVEYYAEITEFLFNPQFKLEDISHIIMCCGVQWNVEDINVKVPGTDIEWQILIDNSLVFPYVEECYLFPFSLLWVAPKGLYATTRSELESKCREKVKNLDVKNMFVSYDNLRQLDLYNLGLCYEKLFASCLATKYYLMSLKKNKKSILFSDIYGKDETQNVLSNVEVDFSEGICLPNNQYFVNTENLPPAVIHNVNTKSAHHDIILPAKLSENKGIVIAVSCKSSFKLSGDKTIQEQLQISKKDKKKVDLLIWLYKGPGEAREAKYQNVVFLNGAGCCNGLALDLLILTKKLTSQNNQR